MLLLPCGLAGSAFHASITRLEKKCFLTSNLALGFSSFRVFPLDLLSLVLKWVAGFTFTKPFRPVTSFHHRGGVSFSLTVYLQKTLLFMHTHNKAFNSAQTHAHGCTHARTHERTHARTHARIERTQNVHKRHNNEHNFGNILDKYPDSFTAIGTS